MAGRTSGSGEFGSDGFLLSQYVYEATSLSPGGSDCTWYCESAWPLLSLPTSGSVQRNPCLVAVPASHPILGPPHRANHRRLEPVPVNAGSPKEHIHRAGSSRQIYAATAGHSDRNSNTIGESGSDSDSDSDSTAGRCRIFGPPCAPPIPREPSSRLWNPINSSPRLPPAIVHAPPNIPITHPELTEGRAQQSAEGRDAYPLLTLSEQRRSRHSYAGSSAIVEGGSVSGRNSAAIPEGQRRSFTPSNKSPGITALGQPQSQFPFDARRAAAAPPAMKTTAKIPRVEDAGRHTSSSTAPAPQPASHDVEASAAAPPLRRTASRSSLPATLSRRTSQHTTYTSRPSTTAPHDPDSDDDDDALPWSPAHPCYPHPNPHVPLTSPLAHSTRIIRIQRDWLAGTDAVPAFANLYPEILDPVLPEPAFRLLIAHVNAALAAALSPWSWRSWLDALLGAATGWLWEDVGPAGVRGRLRALDAWLERWNRTEGAREGVVVVPLRRTAYLSLDVQIPDPHVGAVEEPGEGEGEREGVAARERADGQLRHVAHAAQPTQPEPEYGAYPVGPLPGLQQQQEQRQVGSGVAAGMPGTAVAGGA
ncbi:hypothetical protein B0A49_03483 [Cryomyces minteri]|uniref:Ras modification protein ERF4 n=1 Tax=Cryomyces minteri TaxID=331657 RepID=A0A4U0X8E3_9PEZI|nr:hypothetical protein B0A49_03483 [Cryomyces minteri]